MAYGWQIKLNGVDISDKVSGFSITCSLDSYCREMNFDIADADLYAELDFAQISETPEIEILTKNGDTFISQGTFFIERPALATTIKSDLMSGVWGRSLTAKLGEPFAPKVTKVWETQTTLFGICEEMCDLAGFTWDPIYSDISDFVVFPYTYEVENVYPVDVITELAELAGALVTTDRLGHLCIRQIDYSPVAADVTIADADIEQISESPEWPAFGNRISITPTGSQAGYSVELIVANGCLAADGDSWAKLYAQVTDADDEPVNNLVVNWEIDSTVSALDYATSNTKTVLIQNEKQKASNFYTVEVDFKPSSVLGIWVASDTAKNTNMAASGYEIDGNKITLTGKFAFCNQTLVISYYSQGIAINYLTAGAVAEDVTVTADVEGQEGTGTVYIDNPCQCPPSIDLNAAPTSIAIGGYSSLIVYVEESGPVTSGRYVFMYEKSATSRGYLDWTKARLGTVSIENEKTTAINNISGLTQCELSMYPASVSAIYLADENGVAYGANLYNSHEGKVVNLNTEIENGTDLLVNYVAQGAALNGFTGTVLGKALIKAYINSTLEEGVEAEATISIEDNAETTDDDPADSTTDPADGGKKGSGGNKDKKYDPSKTDPFPPEGPPGGLPNLCMSDNVSADPNPDALGGRFDTGLAQDGCTCEEMCNSEYDIFSTTQNYDGASGRTISEIVVQDHGLTEGSPEYHEKHAELKQAALGSCEDQCDDPCKKPFGWSDDNPDTIGRSTSAGVSITGGVGPYTWNVSGTGFSLEATETEGGANLLIADGASCGSATISVTDSCGNTVTGYVRSTNGQWIPKTTCGPAAGGCGGTSAYTTGGVFQILADNKTGVYEEVCIICNNASICGSTTGCTPSSPNCASGTRCCDCESRCCNCSCGMPRTTLWASNCADGSQGFSVCAVSFYQEWEWEC